MLCHTRFYSLAGRQGFERGDDGGDDDGDDDDHVVMCSWCNFGP